MDADECSSATYPITAKQHNNTVDAWLCENIDMKCKSIAEYMDTLILHLHPQDTMVCSAYTLVFPTMHASQIISHHDKQARSGAYLII